MKGYYKIALAVYVSIIFADAYMPSWARKYTQSTTGCPCWWDLGRGLECACCKDFGGTMGVPCGYPWHNYCQRKSNWGCPGLLPNGNRRNRVQIERYTLSTRGYPCHYDRSDTSCAWCAIGSQQCGRANTWANNYLSKIRRMRPYYKKENTCLPVLNNDRKSYAKRGWAVCVGQVQDCNKPDSECDMNADCVNTGKTKEVTRGNIWPIRRCACKTGFVGNGIICANETTGVVSRPGIDVKAKLTTDVYEQYELDVTVDVPNHDNFMGSLDKLLSGGTCADGCNGGVVTCPA